MTNEKILRRPLFFGLIVLISAFLIGVANSTAFAQDAASESPAVVEPTAEPAAETAAAESPAVVEPTAEPAAETAAAESPAVVEPTAEPAAETADAEAPAENAQASELIVSETTVEKVGSNVDAGSALVFVLFAVVIVVGFFLARFFAKKYRLPEFRTGYFIIFFCFFGALISTTLGLINHRINLGVDLRGGSILVYSVTPSQTDETGKTPDTISNEQMNKLKNALVRRINPSGVREISIQELGANSEVKITIPEADDAEVARLERVVSSSGQLRFRVLASTNSSDEREKAVVALAEQRRDNPETKIFLDETAQGDGVVIGGTWTPLDPTQNDIVAVQNEKGEWVASPNRGIVYRSSQAVVRDESEGKPLFDVLVLDLIDAGDVGGEHMASVQESVGQMGDPEVVFAMNGLGSDRMKFLTNRYVGRPMGVVLNDRVYSAPNIKSTISDRGSISFGERLNPESRLRIKKEVRDLIAVMDAGVLPAKLSDKPVTKMVTGPTLGADTISKGKNAIIWSGVTVLLFMIAYYGFGGFVAAFAVLMNLFMILAAMIGMHAAFTLPGLAGLVLTVGMAVDANILIFERIREELNGGATLKMAIRNGYQRAFTAIFDSNITTMITAWILYLVGSEQIKSFAVTLFLGVLFSMFTATYVCRIIFQTAEKSGCIGKRCVSPILPGLKAFGRTNFDFFKLCRQTYKISVGIILIGMIALVFRGKGIFDVDFVGGVEIQTVFTEPVEIATVREHLSELPDLSVSELSLAKDRNGNEVQAKTCYTISASCPTDKKADEFRLEVEELMKEKFANLLRHYSMTCEIGAVEQVTPAGSSVARPQIKVAATVNPPLGREVVLGYFQDSLPKDDENPLKFDAVNVDLNAEADAPSVNWTVVFDSDDVEKIKTLCDAATTAVDGQSAFEASNTVGSAVASYARVQGILAILGSLICVVGYLWLRFKRAVFGLSAVVGLVHDVCFTLGLIALSYWLAPFLGFLGVGQFKIGLATVAAFLTLIGYSLNDTIVLFDRIREVRGKTEALSKDIINRATNQTLSRTILTSLTTFFTAVVLYVFGGAGIHTFAFAMMIGVLVGTFSSIFICAPFLYWLMQKQASKAPSGRVKK